MEEMTLEEAINSKSVCRYECGMVKPTKLTGRYIETDNPEVKQFQNQKYLVEVRDTWYSEPRWVPLQYLDEIKELK